MTRLARLALVALAAGSLAGRARADAPEFSSPAGLTGKYETSVHARPRRENDGSIVLTARDLEKRGVDNLAEALALVPELALRDGGRGTIQLDLRGAKQRDVMILIDGVPVDEPYLGSFDLASIPITDIVEIRVTLSPASPLEGPGGPGGLVEVQTLRAAGGRRVSGRVDATSEPGVQGAVSGRANLSAQNALRASAGGIFSDAHYPVIGGDGNGSSFADRREAGHGSLRWENWGARHRLTLDAWAEHRSYFVPPSDTTASTVQWITGESAARVVAGLELTPRNWRIAIGAYTDVLARATDFFSDYALRTKTSHEDLLTDRSGAAIHVDRELGPFFTLSARVSGDFELANDAPSGQRSVQARATFGEAAVGGSLHLRFLRVDGAVGVAAPLGGRLSPWPEGKLQIALALHRAITVRLTGAYKGRVPTLRELYAPGQGNASLNPEFSAFGEAAVIARPCRLVTVRVAGWYRFTHGLIRLDAARFQFANLDDIQARGIEAGVELARDRLIGGGLAYLFQDASSPSEVLGLEPIQNFPHHRVDAWLSSSWRNRVGGLLRVRYTSSRLDMAVLLPAYATVDLSAWWKFDPRMRLTARVDNLTDNRYEARAGVQALGRVFELVLDATFE